MDFILNASGAGKTGIDAVLFLLNQNVDPNKISWVMPNDPWLVNRDKFEDIDGLLVNMETLVR